MIIDLMKDFFFLGRINAGIKEVVIEFFHEIELIIYSTLDFYDDTLSTLVIDH